MQGVVFLLLLSGVHISHQHAIFKEPPARQSMAIFKPQCPGIPRSNDHMSVWCGGAGKQHKTNGGKCGICGDDFSAPIKDHQAGGKYATGTISRSYMPGQIIDVEIDLVANHKGFFTFAICPHNDVNSSPNRNCFLSNPLTVMGGESQPARFYATLGTGLKKMKVQLPNISCKQCIFQFTYTNGNNWGAGPQSAEVQTKDCLTTAGKLGCGPQEEFRGCADLCIGSFCPKDECAKVGDIGGGTPTPTTPTPTRPTPTPSTPPVTRPVTPTPTPPPVRDMCLSAGIKEQYFSKAGDQYCKKFCLNRTRAECHLGGNTKLLCYCSNSTSRSAEEYRTITLDIPDSAYIH